METTTTTTLDNMEEDEDDTKDNEIMRKLSKMTDDEMLHITKVPITSVEGRLGHDRKPSKGFWYSPGSFSKSSWVSWCSYEMPEWVDPTTHQYIACKILETAFVPSGAPAEPTVARISTENEFHEFHKHFACLLPIYENDYVFGIDWDRVRHEGWAGVYIDFQYDCHRVIYPRPTVASSIQDQICGWYHGWDCSSGCVWNIEAILSHRML
jgi:hypothetical protein